MNRFNRLHLVHELCSAAVNLSQQALPPPTYRISQYWCAFKTQFNQCSRLTLQEYARRLLMLERQFRRWAVPVGGGDLTRARRLSNPNRNASDAY